MLCELLHGKLTWMPSVCYIPSYYLQNCVYLYFVPPLLNRVGSLLAEVAALFGTSLSVVKRAKLLVCDSKSLVCSRAQIES